MRWIIVMALTLATGAAADFLAYAVTDKGKSPLPEEIDPIDAKHLVNLEWGDFAGKRSRVGVLEVDNNSTAGSYRISVAGANVDYSATSSQVPVNGIEAIVTDTMNRSGRFRLVERQVLDQVLGEQDLAASGRIAKPSGAATGNVLGAEYLVQVVITDYESNVKNSSKGIGGFLSKKVPVLGGVGVKSGQGRVGMNFRLIDAETSEVMYTKQIESIIKEAGLIFGGGTVIGDLGLGGFMSNYSRTPIGQAVIAGINKGVYELVKEIGARPAEGTVIQSKANQVWLNIGEDGAAVGDRFDIMRKGQELIDPETGISLGSSDSLLGEVEVSQVQEKFSIARVINLSGQASRGDKAVSKAAAPTIEFASSWKAPKKQK